MVAPNGAGVSQSYPKWYLVLTDMTKEKEEAETGKLEGPLVSRIYSVRRASLRATTRKIHPGKNTNV